MNITLKLMIITPYHSQAHIISCNSSKVGCLFLGLVVVYLPHHYTTTINHSLTHSLTHQQQVLVLGLGFFVCWVFFFCLVLFVITATSKQNKQASKETKQTSKQANKQTSKQASKQTNKQASKQTKQVLRQSNSTAASKLSSTEPITRFFFYPFSSLQCSVPGFCEDLSKPHFS
jgi:large-conductance mechanosensitive channel